MEKGKNGNKKSKKDEEELNTQQSGSKNSKEDLPAEIKEKNDVIKPILSPVLSTTISKVRNDSLLKNFWFIFNDDAN